MNTFSQPASLKKMLLIDVLVLVLVLLIPAISHLAPFPLYYLDPMRIMLFLGFLLSRNNTNAIGLAVIIPLFSMMVTGHPIPFKSILISIELVINIYLFIFLQKKLNTHTAIAMIVSIAVSKVVYYFLKYIFLSIGLFGGNLISTGIYIQLIIAIFISFLFAFFYNKINTQND